MAQYNNPDRIPRKKVVATTAKTMKKKAEVAEKISEVPQKRWIDVLLCIGIFLFSILLYVNTFNHEWVLDDYGAYRLNRYVTHETESLSEAYENILTKTYRHGSGFYTDNLYRPFSQLMFATEWELCLDKQKTKEDIDYQYISHFSHKVNVFFYALSCILLYILMRKLFRGQNRLIPLVITLLFAAHPIHTETVANTKSRDDIMCMFFLFSSMICMLNYVDTKSMARKLLNLGGVFCTFLLAAFSKESAITFLAAMPLMLYFFRKPSWKEIGIVFANIAVPAMIFLLVRQNVLTNYPSSKEFTVSIMDHYYYNIWDRDIFSYWATAIMLLGKYLLILVIPYQQVCDYSFSQLPIANILNWNEATTVANFYFILSLLIHLALLVYAICGIKKKNPIAFGILYYIITMSIFSNLAVRIGSSFADRFLYLPSMGYCIAMACLLYNLSVKFINRKKSEKEEGLDITGNNTSIPVRKQPVLIAICLIIIGLFSYKTVIRAAEWKTQYDLFGADVKKSDNSAHMRLYWGLALRDKGLELKEVNEQEKDWNKIQANNQEFEKWTFLAMEQFRKGIEIYHESADCNEQMGIAFENLAELHPDRHYRDSAERYYLRALEIVPSKAATNSNLAKIYFDGGKIELAKKYYMLSILFDPIFADGYFNLGSCYGMQQQYDSSFYYYEQCLKLQPERAECYTYMGLSYANIGNYDKAVEMYEKGIALKPYLGSTYILAAKTYFTMGKFAEAENEIKRCLDAAPFTGEAYFVKGLLECQKGQFDQAIESHKKCIELQPEMAEAYFELGKIYFQEKKDRKMADQYFSTAYQLKPQLFIQQAPAAQ